MIPSIKNQCFFHYLHCMVLGPWHFCARAHIISRLCLAIKSAKVTVYSSLVTWMFCTSLFANKKACRDKVFNKRCVRMEDYHIMHKHTFHRVENLVACTWCYLFSLSLYVKLKVIRCSWDTASYFTVWKNCIMMNFSYVRFGWIAHMCMCWATHLLYRHMHLTQCWCAGLCLIDAIIHTNGDRQKVSCS